MEHRWLYRHASLPGLWMLVLVPVLTLTTVLGGMPGWAWWVILGLQAALLWAAFRLLQRPDVTDTASGGAHINLRDRATVVATLQNQQTGPTCAAALAVRLDEAERLSRQLGQTRYAALLDMLTVRLGAVLRAQDQFCPLVDDGFGIALGDVTRGLDTGNVLSVCQRIRTQLGEPLTIGGVALWPSVSIGYCVSPRAAMLNGLDMLQASETAARKALNAGPGAVVSYSVVDFPASLNGKRVDELRRAMETGEIRAHFQPQIRTDTGAVSGLEALARWHHPTSGVLPPGEFLPQIEAAGLSGKLAELMLREALVTLTSLQAAGHDVPQVSINYSAEDLRNPRLADEIAWELDRFDLSPERLSIEILENVVTNGDDDAAVHTIARLATMGCGIDLDDFGTGHASIANIRRFAVSRIKIDRSFVTNLHVDEDQCRMVAAILSMARQLGHGTLAEGVEHPGEQVKLAQMGCEYLQGFAIARPMPASDLPSWLKAHHTALERGEPWVEDAPHTAAPPGHAAQ
ncbi:EAL domain-containing protein [Rhodobacter sp. NTK016B]|uniref:bifunctional diguanylate cyclase/phosphodiesterase n=2 Tax=Bacteria TaxID=2 RepID=UPI001A8F20EF|nr:EAL domain-containing protein [Rhodobacter sp. NTK016B]MBN8293027.1 EAL domain-containing protein [Rhodobacter sp. NTK016B]